MVELGRTDRLLLFELQRDGSLTNEELAERVHVSRTACSRHRHALEEAGVILGHAFVDSARVGCPETLFVTVTLHSDTHDDMAAFEEAVREIDEVMDCYAVAGHLDYLLRVVARDTPHYERIHDRLTRLPGVERMESSLVMHTAVRRTALPLE